MSYELLADAVLLAHFGIVLFVIGGLLAVPLGSRRRWSWVGSAWFRVTHLATTAFVAIQAWLGQLCPLTTLEFWLRARSGGSSYSRSFIQHWTQRLIYYEAPAWVFVLAYTLFAALVVAAWWRYPPGRMRHGGGAD